VSGRLVRVLHPAHSLFDLRDEGSDEGRASCTAFAVLERRGERALLSVRPVTGRTHQIRVHAAGSGCPLVGDSLYGQGWSPAAEPWSARRLQLHALRVALRAPGGGRLVIEAPPPRDFGLDAD
jgi:23S rRNA-/tRNA-specific pseudouridylate synthase